MDSQLETPLYVMRDPEGYAADQKQRILDLGCSEEYAEEARVRILDRAVRVQSSFEANLKAGGRT